MTTYSTGETIQSGDIVRVGKGKAEWQIMGIPGSPTRDGVTTGYHVSGPRRNMFIPAEEHPRLSLIRAWVPCGAAYSKHTHEFTCTLAPSDHAAHEDHKTDAPAVVCWEESEAASEAPAAPVAVGDTVIAQLFGRPVVSTVREVLDNGAVRISFAGATVTDWQPVPADYDPESVFADAAAYVAEVAPEVFAAGARAADTVALGYDPNTDGLPDPDNAEHVAAWLAFTPTEASARAAAVAMDAAFSEFDAKHAPEAEDTDGDDVERCPVCGEPSDYCQGHGEVGDNRGWLNMIAHDHGDHVQCDPRGCEAAGTTEHADYPHHVGYLDSCFACTTGACVCCESDSLAPCVSDDCEAREFDDETDELVDSNGDHIATIDAHTGDVVDYCATHGHEFDYRGAVCVRTDCDYVDAEAIARHEEYVSRRDVAFRTSDEPCAGESRPSFGGVLAVVVALALWFFAGAFGVSTPAAVASPVSDVAEVTEDSDAWNCATMGDHECGPRAAVPTVPVHCLALPGRPGNTRYVMVAPVAGLLVGCEA